MSWKTFLLDARWLGSHQLSPDSLLPGKDEGREDRKGSVEKMGLWYRKAYPKIHFLDHLLGITLQNHTTR